MKLGLFSAFILTAAIGVAAQSARVKASPTPTPNPNLRPSVIFIPTAKTEPPRPRTAPSPSPTPPPKLNDDSQVVKIESTLVPIPVSVVDGQGRAITNLKLEDFELKI